MKLLKLIKNENTKEMKKISTKIFIAVSMLMIIFAVAFVMLIKWLSGIDIDSSEDYWKEMMQDQLSSYRVELARAKETRDIASQMNYEAQIKVYEYALEHNINIEESIPYWKANLLNQLIREEAILSSYKDSIDKTQFNKQNEKVEKMYKLIEDDDFKGYIEFKKEEEKEKLDNKIVTKEEYDATIEILELKEKYEISKDTDENNTWKNDIITEIETIKEELRTNFNPYTKKLLSYEQKQELEDSLKINLYRLEKNIIPVSGSIGESSYRNYFDMVAENFSMIIVSILVIMIAGSTIGSEYSKGTIKFLVMTPNKRWKILLAKFINAVIIMVILTILLSLVTLVVGNIFFANSLAQPYLYVQNGEVKELNHTVYTMLRFLTEDIDILLYLLFALMLSVITRNTAVSIGVSIATYLGSSVVMTILNTFVKNDWIKFIPFNNLGFTDRIFTNTNTLLTQELSTMMNNVSIQFSLCVLGVCAVLMIVTMFDSFNKRDIK